MMAKAPTPNESFARYCDRLAAERFKSRHTVAEARALIDLQSAVLDRAERLASDVWQRNTIARYRAKLAFYARNLTPMDADHVISMVGHNGYGPGIHDCLRRAKALQAERIVERRAAA